MGIGFRVGAAGDLETVLGLMQDYYAYDGHEYEDAKARRALGDLLRDEQWGCVWVIEDGDTAVGYMVVCYGYSLEFGGRDAFVDEIYLRETYRGQGIGRQAVEVMAAACRAAGVRALHLEVMPGNTEVIRFYERAGFVNRGSHLMSRYL